MTTQKIKETLMSIKELTISDSSLALSGSIDRGDFFENRAVFLKSLKPIAKKCYLVYFLFLTGLTGYGEISLVTGIESQLVSDILEVIYKESM